MLPHILDRISYWSLFLVIVLLPVFILPFTRIPIETAKGFLIVIGLTISFVFWVIARFTDGKIVLARSATLLAALGIAAAFLVSALNSGATNASMFGVMFDVGTFWFIFSAFLLMLLSSMIFRNPKNSKNILLGVILSSAVVLVFQIFHLFFPAFSSLGVLVQKTDNVLGSWNALGLYIGFFIAMLLFVLEFFLSSPQVKLVLGILLALAVFLLAAVNFTLVWELLGVTALIVFIYKISFFTKAREREEEAQFPVFSFAIVLISLFFFMSGNFATGYISRYFNITNADVRPSLASTISVTRQELSKDPFFGIGPNRFSDVWAKYKPASINQSQFWDLSFNSGFGMLPTFPATTGYLGLLAWVLFFLVFISAGFKYLFSSMESGNNREVAAFFVASLYLFISSFFYSTGPVIFLLAFAFSGVFVGMAAHSKSKELSISFLHHGAKSFVFMFALILLLVASSALAFKYVERFSSVVYFRKALAAQTVPDAEANIIRSVNLHQNDLYLRTYSQIYLLKLNSMVSKAGNSNEKDKTEMQTNLDQAKNSAILATMYDNQNYLNFTSLGSVFQVAAAIGVPGAYEKAIEAYQNAATLNPLNPAIPLALARTAYSTNKVSEAKKYGEQALALKADYLDALITLSVIAKGQGNTNTAISYAEKALLLVPQNQDLIKYVNSLKNGGSATLPASLDTSKPAPSPTKKP